MEQEQVWDEIAPLWNKYKMEQVGNRLFVEDFISKEDKKVLDLGCGSGRNFFKFDGVIYGVDFSKEQLKLAKINADKKNIKVELTKSDCDNLPFEDNFFDKALFLYTLHCIESSEKRKKSLKELYRVLKPKARAIVAGWNKDSKRWKNKPKEKLVSWNLGDKKVLRYYYLYDFEELINLLKSVGFKIVKHNYEKARNVIIELEKT